MVAGAAVVGVWLVIVFAGILARADELDATQRAEQADFESLTVHAELADREIDFIETDQFVRQAARAEGYGAEGERRFRLPDDAPPPPTITPLGAP
jgi:hypothetical protein